MTVVVQAYVLGIAVVKAKPGGVPVLIVGLPTPLPPLVAEFVEVVEVAKVAKVVEVVEVVEEDVVSGESSSLRMGITSDVVRLLVANDDDKDNVGVAGTPNGDDNKITMS